MSEKPLDSVGTVGGLGKSDFQPCPENPIVFGPGRVPEASTRRRLFTQANFTSHSGLALRWKIDADALTAEDWAAIASFVGPRLRFRAVHGVPRGGLSFADALRPYASEDGGLLIVDDVLTTGGSMEEARARFEGEVTGVVLFSRAAACPEWIVPVFELNPAFCDAGQS